MSASTAKVEGIQWNITDTIENQTFVSYSKVSRLRGFQYISSGCGIRNQAVEHNVTAFQSFSLLYASRKCYAEASTTSNSTNMTSSC